MKIIFVCCCTKKKDCGLDNVFWQNFSENLWLFLLKTTESKTIFKNVLKLFFSRQKKILIIRHHTLDWNGEEEIEAFSLRSLLFDSLFDVKNVALYMFGPHALTTSGNDALFKLPAFGALGASGQMYGAIHLDAVKISTIANVQVGKLAHRSLDKWVHTVDF